MKRDNAAGIRAVYDSLKKKILLQKQSERQNTHKPKHK